MVWGVSGSGGERNLCTGGFFPMRHENVEKPDCRAEKRADNAPLQRLGGLPNVENYVKSGENFYKKSRIIE